MRTNIDIDDKLIAEAMSLTGATTKKQAVDEALREVVKLRKAREAIRSLYGQVQWEGDLDAMRRAD